MWRGRLQAGQGQGGERSPQRNKESVWEGFKNTKGEGKGSISGGGTKFKSEAHRHLKGKKCIKAYRWEAQLIKNVKRLLLLKFYCCQELKKKREREN